MVGHWGSCAGGVVDATGHTSVETMLDHFGQS